MSKVLVVGSALKRIVSTAKAVSEVSEYKGKDKVSKGLETADVVINAGLILAGLFRKR